MIHHNRSLVLCLLLFIHKTRTKALFTIYPWACTRTSVFSQAAVIGEFPRPFITYFSPALLYSSYLSKRERSSAVFSLSICDLPRNWLLNVTSRIFVIIFANNRRIHRWLIFQASVLSRFYHGADRELWLLQIMCLNKYWKRIISI